METNALTGCITSVVLRCRLVDMKSIGADANSKFAFMFESMLTNSPYFLPEGTKLSGNLDPAGDNLTYTFQVNLVLKRPLKIIP